MFGVTRGLNAGELSRRKKWGGVIKVTMRTPDLTATKFLEK